MINSVFILVGAKKPIGENTPIGGILSLSMELAYYAASQKYGLEIIDTLQSSFPVPSGFIRLKNGLNRILKLVNILHTKKIAGVILFSGEGASFYERTLMTGICRIYGVKSIIMIVSGFFAIDVEQKPFTRFAAKFLLKLPNIVAMQGNSWRSLYQKLNVPSDKMLTVRNWLPSYVKVSSSPRNLNPGERLRFCFLGWLVKEKGVSELMDAIISLASRYDFEFIFIGSGTLQVELEKIVEQNNLRKRVYFTGWVKNCDVATHLDTSHVFVLPSKAEGFPNALLEAFALGLPAICTDVGTIADSLQHERNGYLLKDGSSESIAKAMENYLMTPDLIRSHSMESLSVLKQHDMDKNCSILFEQFNT